MATASVSAGTYRSDPGGPLLFLFLSCNDGAGTTAARAGVAASLVAANGPETVWGTTVDSALAAGFDGLYFSWYAGQADETKQQNLIGYGPVATGNVETLCTPITEAQGLTISSSNANYVAYLENLSNFVAARAASMVRPIFYAGCVPANAVPGSWATAFPTAVAVNAQVAMDAISALDYTFPRCSVAAIDVINSPGGVVKVSFVAEAAQMEDGSGNLPTNGVGIALWADDSGNGDNASQSTAGNRPTFRTANGPGGLGCVRFDGSNDYLETTTSQSLGDFWVLCVFKDPSTTVASERIVDHSYITGFYLARASTGSNSWGGGIKETSAPYGTFGTCADGSWHVLDMRRSSTTKTVHVDGTSLGNDTVAGSATGSNKLRFGQALDTTGSADIDLYAVVLCNTAIADNLRGLVQQGFAMTTGIAVAGSPSLPQKSAWTGLIGSGIMVWMEGWSRRDLTAQMTAWGTEAAAGHCFGGQIGITNHHRSFYNPADTNTWGSADYNSAAGASTPTYQNEYNMATDYDNGNGNPPVRPMVLIVGETLAERVHEMRRWVAKGCSIAIEASTDFVSVVTAFRAAQTDGFALPWRGGRSVTGRNRTEF